MPSQPQGKQQRPGLVLVSRVATGPPAVPSDTIRCDLCGQDCWISQYSGVDTLITARRLGGGADPVICCSADMEAISVQAAKEEKTLEAVIAEWLADNK